MILLIYRWGGLHKRFHLPFFFVCSSRSGANRAIQNIRREVIIRRHVQYSTVSSTVHWSGLRADWHANSCLSKGRFAPQPIPHNAAHAYDLLFFGMRACHHHHHTDGAHPSLLVPDSFYFFASRYFKDLLSSCQRRRRRRCSFCCQRILDRDHARQFSVLSR